MTDFKDSKRTMYCTPMDVRAHLDVLNRKISDDDDDLKPKQDIEDSTIEDHILKADSIIDGYLLPVYGATALANETPYFKGPMPVPDNKTSAKLLGIVVASTAITEQWLILFTADDAFAVYGTFSGSQGTGTIAGDFTSTNSDIQIKTVDWLNIDSEVIGKGDQFLVSTYIAHKLVATISSMIAASALIDALHSETEEKSSSFGRTMYKKAIDLLKALADENNNMSLTSANDSSVREMVATGYNIDKYGADGTEYDIIDNDSLPDYD